MTTRPWKFTRYGTPNDGGFISPNVCHPDVAEWRDAYILERYGAAPIGRSDHADLWCDLGGPVYQHDPAITPVDLGEGRTFGCYVHQSTEILSYLEGRTKVQIGPNGLELIRFNRWPGVLCFVTVADMKTILAALRNLSNPTAAVRHRQEVDAVLDAANAAATVRSPR